MVSKADVLAARIAYERVAEAYLQECGWNFQGRYYPIDNRHVYGWEPTNGCVRGLFTFHEAIEFVMKRQEPPHDR